MNKATNRTPRKSRYVRIGNMIYKENDDVHFHNGVEYTKMNGILLKVRKS